MRLELLIAGLALGVVACGDGGPAAGGGGPARARIDVERLRAATAARAPDELVLDARADGALLVGRVDPVPPNADPVRTLRVRLLQDGRELPWTLAGRPLQDARLLPGGGVLALAADGTLSHLADPRAPAETVDRGAMAPLSVSADGRAAVYVRGELADTEVVRLDVFARTARPVAAKTRPAWCPAISPDGRTVVWVSSARGTPTLHRLDEGDAGPRTLGPAADPTAPPPLPAGPTAPLLLDDLRLVFEDERGLVILGPDGVARAALPGAHLPVLVREAGVVLAHDGAGGGGLRWLGVDELRAAR